MSYRCPKTGRYVSLMECMYCDKPLPNGDYDSIYDLCREMNGEDEG